MKAKKILVQLGNPFDTDGARLVEAYLVGTVCIAAFGSSLGIVLFRGRDERLWVGHAQMKRGPDFPNSEAYCTAALPLEPTEDQSRFPDAEKQFGINRYYLKNHWWTKHAEENLAAEPVETLGGRARQNA